jgi:hypothetical protein
VISKYNGVCVYCGKPTKGGTDPYDVDTKKAFHEKCHDSQPPSLEQFSEATRLGFLPHDQAMEKTGWTDLRYTIRNLDADPEPPAKAEQLTLSEY